MKVIHFLTLVVAIFLTLTGFAQAQIPTGLTKYNLKQVNDLQNVMNQARDLGVTDEEMAVVVRTAVATVGTGASALILDNKHPNYTLTFGGATLSFESGKEFVLEYMTKTGKALYTVENNKFIGKERLDNGKTVDAQVTFEGKEVTVIRKSPNVNLEVTLNEVSQYF